jgi:WD40 repeat protein
MSQVRRCWLPAAAAAAAAPPIATSHVRLERVRGHTVNNAEAVAYRPYGKELAYVAGSVVVLYHEIEKKQSNFFVGRQGRELHCVSWHPTDENQLYAGESGPDAAVIVWDVRTGHRLSILLGHSGAVTHIRMSPLGSLLVVVSEEDSQHNTRSNVSVWRVLDQQLVWSHTEDKRVQCITWNTAGTFFAIGGAQFLKVCNVSYTESDTEAPVSVLVDVAQLGKDSAHANKNADLVSLAFGDVYKDISKPAVQGGALLLPPEPEYVRVPNVIIALSKHGMGSVCIFEYKTSNNTTLTTQPGSMLVVDAVWDITIWMVVRVDRFCSLSMEDDLLCLAGGDGKMRLFDTHLRICDTIHKLPQVSSSYVRHGMDVTLCAPDVVAARIIPGSVSQGQTSLVVFYADRSIAWIRASASPISAKKADTITPAQRVEHMQFSHRGPVWDLASITVPTSSNKMPAECFASCSADGSIRWWGGCDDTGEILPCAQTNVLAAYSQILRKHNEAVSMARLRHDTDSRTMKQVEGSYRKSKPFVNMVRAPSPPRQDGMGIRCIKYSPSVPTATANTKESPLGFLASGDDEGFVRLYRIGRMTSDWKIVGQPIKVHAQPVCALEWCQVSSDVSSLLSVDNDKTIHATNVCHPDRPAICTPKVMMDWGPIVFVKCITILPLASNRLHFVIGCDHALVMQSFLSICGTIDLDSVVQKAIRFDQEKVMDIAVSFNRQLAFVLVNGPAPVRCVIHVVNLRDFCVIRSYSFPGEPLRIALDPSDTFLGVCCSNELVLLVDWLHGTVVESFYGHSESALALLFTEDLTSIITSGRDGTIMTWKLDKIHTDRMQQAVSKADGNTKHTRPTALSLLDDDEDDDDNQENDLPHLPPLTDGGSSPKGNETEIGYKPRMVPSWAQSTGMSSEQPSKDSIVALQGRWASRVEENVAEAPVTFASLEDEDIDDGDGSANKLRAATSSLQQREAQTSQETAILRQHLQAMGVLHGGTTTSSSPTTMTQNSTCDNSSLSSPISAEYNADVPNETVSSVYHNSRQASSSPASLAHSSLAASIHEFPHVLGEFNLGLSRMLQSFDKVYTALTEQGLMSSQVRPTPPQLKIPTEVRFLSSESLTKSLANPHLHLTDTVDAALDAQIHTLEEGLRQAKLFRGCCRIAPLTQPAAAAAAAVSVLPPIDTTAQQFAQSVADLVAQQVRKALEDQRLSITQQIQAQFGSVQPPSSRP